MILLTIFLHQKVKKNQKSRKGPSFEPICGVLTCLLKLRWQIPHICSFLDCFSFSYFLATSFCFQNKRQNSLNSRLNLDEKSETFAVQMYQFLPSEQSSTANLAAIFQRLQKAVRALRVNDTKVTSINAFINHLFE